VPVPFVPEDVVELNIYGVNDDLPWHVIQHVKTTESGSPDAADVLALCTFVSGAWETSFLERQNDHIDLVGVEAVWNDGAGGFIDANYVHVVAGGDSGAPLDASVSVVVSWRVGTIWRGGHPRSYIPGVSQDRLSSVGSFSSATVTDYQAAAAEYLSLLNASGPGDFDTVTMGCLRRFADGGSETIPPTYLDPPVFVPFTGVTTRAHVGSQRRRLGPF
jgi:hypothetical protein